MLNRERHFYPSFIFLIVIFGAISVKAFAQQTATVKGRVINENHRGISDVNLGLQGTSMGTASNEKGYFTIQNISPGNYIFIATAVGFKTVRKSVVLNGSQTLQIIVHLSRSTHQLEQIIVEGEDQRNSYAVEKSSYVAKILLNRLENPQVYNSIPQKLITDQMDYSVGEALKNATGLQKMWGATGRGGDGGAYYNSRGFVLQSKLRDGVAGNITNRIDAVNIKKIEVIKGPSATLFGSTLTSYGGLINRVTKKPHPNFGGSVSLSTGNYGFKRLAADVNTPLDPKEKVLLRVNGAYNYKGSFQDNAFGRYFVFDPSLTYKVNDRMTLSIDGELYWGRNLTTNFTFLSPSLASTSDLGANRVDELPVAYRRRFASNDLVQVSRNSNFFSNLTYEISNHWTAKTYVTTTHSYSNGPNPFLYLLSNVEVTGNPNDIGADYVSRNDQSTRNSKDDMLEIQQNFNGTFTLGSLKNRFVGGIDYFHHNSNQLFVDAVFDTVASHGTIPTYGDFNKTNLKAVYTNEGPNLKYPINYIANTYSAYASDVLNITNNLLAMAALRVDYFVNNGSYDPSTGTTSGGYHQLALSPKFGLVYQPFQKHLSLFANYQNGFTNQNGTNYKGKAFTPERANQWEGGIKLNLWDSRLSSTISYYDIRVKNIVLPDPNHPNFSIQNGIQSSNGLEASITANPMQGLNLTAGAAYNHSKYEEADKNTVGLRPSTAGSPWRAHWWISYRLTGKLTGMGIGFGGTYASNNKIINNRKQGTFILPAYTVLNASVFYNYDDFRFSLKMNNLTDKHYWTGYATFNPQELRSIAGSITFNF